MNKRDESSSSSLGESSFKAKRVTIELDDRTYGHLATKAQIMGRSIEEEAAQWLTAQIITDTEEYDDILEDEGEKASISFMNSEVLRRRSRIKMENGD